MSEDPLTVHDVIAEVRRLAAEEPYRVQAWPPKYVHRTRSGQRVPGQGCIIGEALYRLGLDVLPECEGQPARDVVRHLVHCRVSDARDLAWLRRVQQAADPDFRNGVARDGQRWGRAVVFADEMARTLD